MQLKIGDIWGPGPHGAFFCLKRGASWQGLVGLGGFEPPTNRL